MSREAHNDVLRLYEGWPSGHNLLKLGGGLEVKVNWAINVSNPSLGFETSSVYVFKENKLVWGGHIFNTGLVYHRLGDSLFDQWMRVALKALFEWLSENGFNISGRYRWKRAHV